MTIFSFVLLAICLGICILLITESMKYLPWSLWKDIRWKTWVGRAMCRRGYHDWTTSKGPRQRKWRKTCLCCLKKWPKLLTKREVFPEAYRQFKRNMARYDRGDYLKEKWNPRMIAFYRREHKKWLKAAKEKS